MSAAVTERRCKRCQANKAAIQARNEWMCEKCFDKFVVTKLVKRLSIPQREGRSSSESYRPPRYLVGLSFGQSSATLIHMLSENQKYLLQKNVKGLTEVMVVHVAADLDPADDAVIVAHAQSMLEMYRARYPSLSFDVMPLSSVVDLPSVDWSHLPGVTHGTNSRERLRRLLDGLPEHTSTVDVLHLLTRHVLIAAAQRNRCDALLLGSTSTALAELTFSEVAKGRGFSVPWQINDGLFPIGQASQPENSLEEARQTPLMSTATFPVHYPLRDLLRKEVVAYAKAVKPPLTELISVPPTQSKTPVSHKDMSIDQVISSFFEDAEQNYPSVVANVVRTTGKLSHPEGTQMCGLCGLALDETGNTRWKGELLDDGPSSEAGQLAHRARLCYGCERTIYG